MQVPSDSGQPAQERAQAISTETFAIHLPFSHLNMFSRLLSSGSIFRTLTQRVTAARSDLLTASPFAAARTGTLTPQVTATRGFKVRSSLKKRCEHCFFVHRRKKLFVICKENPKHKQRQG